MGFPSKEGSSSAAPPQLEVYAQGENPPRIPREMFVSLPSPGPSTEKEAFAASPFFPAKEKQGEPAAEAVPVENLAPSSICVLRVYTLVISRFCVTWVFTPAKPVEKIH